MKSRSTQRLHTVLLAILLSFSIFSFVYVNSVDLKVKSVNPDVETIYAEDLDESEDMLPDVHLLKQVMQKAMEFMIVATPLKGI